MDVGVEEKTMLQSEVMDTPDRSKNGHNAATSITKFEDSPIFSFLNSLSPIKPVKSMHATQTINPLSFASLPSVFTSPHVSSLKESRFLRRCPLSDLSKPDFSSDDVYANNVNVDVAMKLEKQKENVESSNGEVAGEPSYDCSQLVRNFYRDTNSQTSCLSSSHSCTSSAVEPVTYKSEGILKGVGCIDQNKEAVSCDWESLISEASNLLFFDSPNESESHRISVDPSANFFRSIKNAIQNVEHVREGNNVENMSIQGSEMMENGGILDMIDGSSISNPSEQEDPERLFGLCRGVRRRCLLFETGRGNGKHVEYSTGSDSPMLLKSDENTSSDQQTLRKKMENDPPRLFSRIGLHLNAFPATYKFSNQEASASRRLLIGPRPSSSFRPPTSSQELLNNTSAEFSLDRPIGNGDLPMEDPFQEPGFITNDEINPSSPRKKKRRLEQGGEGEGCRRCNCKKSKCLKLYCECFAAGVYCVEPCACIECFNKPVHEDTVLATRKQIESRNPLAFAPKVIRGSETISEIGDDFTNTPASARHKRGCNCKKSGCLKKYCECYQGGVGCSLNCRCEGCKNAFGRKNGTDHELEEDETDTNEKAVVNQGMDSAPLATPSRIARLSVDPLTSKKRPPRSSFPSICSTSASIFPPPPPPPKFNHHFETIREDELPGFLQVGSPITGVKSSSPNRKRVSPPQNIGASSGQRSSRRLILQSIPAFPSLTSNH